MSAIISVNSKDRVLSPKRRKEFSGQLTKLEDGSSKDNFIQAARPTSAASKQVLKRPSSGSLEVLESGNDNKPSQEMTSHMAMRPGSGRTEKKLPSVKRKIENDCLCHNVQEGKCQWCNDMAHAIKDLNIEGNAVNNPDIKTRDCMAPRFEPGKQAIAATQGNKSSAANEEGDSLANSASYDDDDEDDDDGRNENKGTSSLLQSPNKAPIELLSRFLSAVMKKEYLEAEGLCNQILAVEPNNRTCLEFRLTLRERIEQEEDSSSSDDDSEEDTDDSDEEDQKSDEDSGNEGDNENNAEDDSENDSDNENIDVNVLNLFMGGLPIKKETPKI